MSPQKHSMAPTVIQTLRHSSIAVLNFDYTLVNPSPSSLPVELKSYGLKTLESDLMNSDNAIKDIQSMDLLIARTDNTVAKYWNIEQQINSFNKALKVLKSLLTMIFILNYFMKMVFL